MKRFQIIAIKTGNDNFSVGHFLSNSNESVEIDYLKNLEKNKVYSFNENYSFPNGDFSIIEYNSNNDLDLYSLILSDGRKIPVNICAIVGENGSGKSALIELLYWVNYNLACQMNLLMDEQGTYYEPNTLDLELLYSTNDGYILLKVSHLSSKIIKFQLEENPYHGDGISINSKTEISNLKHFFYSIVVNYSQYALNAREVGEWVNPLFHKNDGYQTPIVLNPMRIDGNIDINRERELLSRRLQSNVLEPVGKKGEIKNSIRNLANGKIAEYFEVEFIQDYFKTKNNDVPKEKRERIISRLKENLKERYLDNEKLICDVVAYCYEPRLESKIPNIDGLEESIINQFGVVSSKVDVNFYVESLNYIRKKLVKMVYQYYMYEQFRDEHGGINDIDGLITKIKAENSHTAFKVKGAILHLKHYEKIYKNNNPINGGSFKVNIDEFSKIIELIREEESFKVNCYMMAFPPFFRVVILPENQLSIKDFSSGEKQKINSLSSIVYHLININSVDNNDGFVNYEYVNLIFDEIEMYYHPEWQRSYIYDLLEYLNKINPKDLDKIKGINIFLVTHSPFILSDISNSNIVLLKEGNIENSHTKTFGANVHDLLANEFFMKDGFMGEFAKQRIRSIIEQLECYIRKNKHITDYNTYLKIKLLINSIGEPLIKNSLAGMLHKVSQSINNADEIQKEIDRLTILKEKIQKK